MPSTVTPTPTTLTLAAVENRGERTKETLMEAINLMYRALHDIEDLVGDAADARAALRAQRVG